MNEEPEITPGVGRIPETMKYAFSKIGIRPNGIICYTLSIDSEPEYRSRHRADVILLLKNEETVETMFIG
jgi:hypothetical protein